MGLRDDADIGNVTQGDALELKETCGCRCGAAAVGRDGLENEECRGCDVSDKVCRMRHILCARLCRDDNLDIDIFRARNLKKACVRIQTGADRTSGSFRSILMCEIQSMQSARALSSVPFVSRKMGRSICAASFLINGT